MISEKQWGGILNTWFAVLLIYTAFNTVGDSYALLTGGVATRLVSYTPIWIKLIKDILLVIAVVLIGLHRTKHDWILLFIVVAWFALGAIYAVIWLQYVGQAVFMGVRYMLPAAYILFGYSFRNHSVDKVKPVVAVLLLSHIAMQLLQSIYAPNIFGHTLFGFNLRNTGLFITPTFSGAFPLLCYYWPGAGKSIKTLAILSVILSNSTTCMLVMVVILAQWLLLKFKQRFRIMIGAVTMFVIAPAVLIFLPQITGRGDAVWVSSSSRGQIVAENSKYLLTMGEGFGLGTSMAVLQKVQNAIIADNTLVSSLVSMGGIGMTATAIILIIVAFGLYRRDVGLMLLFVGMCMTVIIFESTPFAQILFFWAGQSLPSSITRSLSNLIKTPRIPAT